MIPRFFNISCDYRSLREKQKERIARAGFEPASRGSKPQMLGHYTTGLLVNDSLDLYHNSRVMFSDSKHEHRDRPTGLELWPRKKCNVKKNASLRGEMTRAGQEIEDSRSREGCHHVIYLGGDSMICQRGIPADIGRVKAPPDAGS